MPYQFSARPKPNRVNIILRTPQLEFEAIWVAHYTSASYHTLQIALRSNVPLQRRQVTFAALPRSLFRPLQGGCYAAFLLRSQTWQLVSLYGSYASLRWAIATTNT